MYARGREKKRVCASRCEHIWASVCWIFEGDFGICWLSLKHFIDEPDKREREREVWIALERVDRRFHTLFSLYCCAGSPIRLKHTLSAAKCPHNIDTHGLSLLLPVCQNHNLLSIPRPLEAIVETTLTNFFKKTKKQQQQQHIKLKISQLKWNNKKQRHFTPKTGKEAN